MKGKGSISIEREVPAYVLVKWAKMHGFEIEGMSFRMLRAIFNEWCVKTAQPGDIWRLFQK